MCKASPGPRCFNSASKSYQSALDNLATAQKKSKEAYKQFDQSIGKADPDTVSTLRLKYDFAKRDELKAEEKVQENRNDMDATVGGMDSLKSQIQGLTDQPDSPIRTIRSLQNRLSKAKKTYDQKLFEFDKAHGTVNGITPSKYGDEEGINMLAKERNDCKKNYGHATTKKEQEKLVQKIGKLDVSIQHAILTKERIEQGLAHPNIKPKMSRVNKLNKDVEKRSNHEQKVEQAQAEFDKLSKRRQQFLDEKSVIGENRKASMSRKDKQVLKTYTQECLEAKEKLSKAVRDKGIHEAVIMSNVADIENSNANASRLQSAIDTHKEEK